jgi:DNA-binding NarL/FixJ family response regulator
MGRPAGASGLCAECDRTGVVEYAAPGSRCEANRKSLSEEKLTETLFFQRNTRCNIRCRKIIIRAFRMEDKIRILLADDHRMMREGIRALLERQPNIQVVGEAADGREVVRLAMQLCPDVVVMDISMPLLNGIEATRRIKRECPSAQVLILTVHESEDYVTQLLTAGASGYIMKRAAAEELIDAIGVVHGGEVFLHPAIAKVVVTDYVRRLKGDSETGDRGVLTTREREILQLIAEGYTNREIADTLHLSIKTVQNHRSKIMNKLDLHNRGELIKYAIQHGIIHL